MTFINMSNITHANSTLQYLIAFDHNVMGGMFAIFVLVALVLIIWINVGETYVPKHALLMASFFGTMIAGMMWIAGALPFYVAIVALVLFMVAMIIVYIYD